jgi:hypothetical protein
MNDSAAQVESSKEGPAAAYGEGYFGVSRQYF